jgi:hypothetical protein
MEKNARFCSRKCWYAYYKSETNNKNTKLIPEITQYRQTHSVAETAIEYGLSCSSMQNFLSKYSVFGKATVHRLQCPDKLSQRQEEIFIGNMLGDGSLSYLKPGTNGNSCFRICQKLDSSEYVQGLQQIYEPFSSAYGKKETRKPSTMNGMICHDIKHWNGKYLASSFLYTVCHPLFTEYRKKWYKDPYVKNSQKIVPLDLKLTWQTAAIWMCDDGSNHCSRSRNLMLHTESFTYDDVNLLRDKLYKDLGIISTLNKHRDKPTIRIGGDNWFNFIENIKPFIPWKCFQYKCISRQKIDRHSLLMKSNTSGHAGVKRIRNRWSAFIYINGQCIRLGNYNTENKAVSIRSAAFELYKNGNKNLEHYAILREQNKEICKKIPRTQQQKIKIQKILRLRVPRSESGFKGITLQKNKHWISKLVINKRPIHLGLFATAQEAAENYDYYAIKFYGQDNCYLNFPNKDYNEFIPKKNIENIYA